MAAIAEFGSLAPLQFKTISYRRIPVAGQTTHRIQLADVDPAVVVDGVVDMDVFDLAKYQIAGPRMIAKTDDVVQHTFEHEQGLGDVWGIDVQGLGRGKAGINKFIVVRAEQGGAF